MKKIKVALPDSLAEEAAVLAAEAGETLGEVIQRALKVYITSTRRREVESEMKKYAQGMADQSGEFVNEVGPTVWRKLLRETRW